MLTPPITQQHVEHTLKAIRDGQIRAEPWPHLVVSDVFTEELYNNLLEHFPTRKYMTPLNERFHARYLYWLECDGLKVASRLPFWDQLHQAFAGPLQLALERKFNVKASYRGMELLHDIEGYRLGPHTDTPDKLVTGLFYLPDWGSTDSTGTVLYRGTTQTPWVRGISLGQSLRG